MNKLFNKIAVGCLGAAMAIGVGVAIGNKGLAKKADAAGISDWQAVTALNQLNTTDKYIITYGTTCYLDGSVTSKGHFNATAFDETHPSGGNDAAVFKLESTGTSNTYKVKFVSSGKYMIATSNGSGSASVSAESDSSGWRFSYSSGFNAIYQKAYSSKYASLRYYSNDYRTYSTNSSSTAASSGEKFNIYKYAAAVNIESITEVTLNRNDVPCNYGGSLTATATYTTSDASEAFIWTSSDETVATVAASTTYGVANISLKNKVGTTTIRAAATHAPSTIYAEVELNVTAAQVVKYLDVTFLSDSDSGTAFADTDAFRANASGDASHLTLNSATRVYPGVGKTIKFNNSSSTGTISLEADKAIKTVVLEVGKYGTDTSDLGVQVGTDTQQTTGTLGDFQFYSFTFANTSSSKTLVLSALNADKGRLYVRNIILVYSEYSDECGAIAHAGKIMQLTQDGCNDSSKTKLETAWTTLSTDWTNSVSDGAKTVLNGVSANKDGNIMEKGIARYEQIVRKHSLTNYMSRTIASNNLVSIAKGNNTVSFATIIVVVSSIALVAVLGTALMIKRRKEDR